jgi:hypothetical protein
MNIMCPLCIGGILVSRKSSYLIPTAMKIEFLFESCRSRSQLSSAIHHRGPLLCCFLVFKVCQLQTKLYSYATWNLKEIKEKISKICKWMYHRQKNMIIVLICRIIMNPFYNSSSPPPPVQIFYCLCPNPQLWGILWLRAI